IFALMVIVGCIAIARIMEDTPIQHDDVAVAAAAFLLMGAIAILILRPSFPAIIEPILGIRFRWVAVGSILIGGSLILLGLRTPPGSQKVLLEGLGYPPLAIGVFAIIVFLMRQMR